MKFSTRIRRLARRRMVARLPYPDPEWRRPFTTARYVVGRILLRPYLDRLAAHYRAASTDGSLPREQRERCLYMGLGVGYVIGLDSGIGRGRSRYLAAMQPAPPAPEDGGA